MTIYKKLNEKLWLHEWLHAQKHNEIGKKTPTRKKKLIQSNISQIIFIIHLSIIHWTVSNNRNFFFITNNIFLHNDEIQNRFSSETIILKMITKLNKIKA